ncbi:MAG: hypothetical protein AB1938_01390 [Myxococcota bacterium]
MTELKRLVVVLVGGMVVSACVTEERSTRVRGASGFMENVPEYPAPAVDRCAKFKKGGGPAAACEEARFLGENYVRRLSPGDQVCLEGGFGEAPTRACLSRGAVVDVATNRILIEVREARPDSKWFRKEQSQFWFQEGALVDLYLADAGY